MDSLEFEKESVSEKSILQVNNSTEKESSKDEKPFYDTIEKGEVLTNYKSERSVQSSEEEQVLNSDTSANEITEDNSHLNESSEENINGVNETVSDRHDDELEESIQHEEPVEGMEIEDDVNEDKNQNQKTVNDSIKLPRFVEVEEEFTGFTPKSDESQVYNIIKDLSQQEEVELKQLENMVDNNVELRPMSPPKKKRKEGEESQGSDMSSQCSSPALSISSQLSAVSNTKRSVTGSPASRGSRKSTADLSNPKYLVPFEHGWRREVVTRAVTSRDDGISKDVYYFHPSGKKLRSLREVTEKCKLTPGLTIDNFTFYKEPLGADPKYETVRNARAHGQSQSPSDFGTPRTPLPAKIKNENVFVKDEFAATPPVKNVLRTPRDRTIAKREKIVLKFNKGTPKIALKKSPAVNGDRKSPKSIIPKLDGPKPHPLAPEGPRRKITPRKSSLSIGKSKDETGANTANNQGGGGDMEMGMLPPTWSPTAGSNKSSSNESLSWSQLDEENYSALLHVFQYLKVQELLRAGRVCRLWRDLASHPSLWRTVRMKNSQVSDWKGFTDSLSRHGTKHLDLRKMLVSLDESEEMWKTLAKHISNVQCLERLDMCRCSVGVIEQIVEACPQLLVFNAPMIGVKDPTVQQKISLDSFSKMTKLTELRMKSFFGLYLNGSLQSLTSLADTLTTLSLTSVKDLGSVNVEFIGDLNLLETLELGECSNLPEEFPTEVIAKLKKLKRIRLEKGPYKCSTNQMLLEMSKLPDLVQLELINFDIKHGFDDALATCTNIKRLLLIPTYVTQSATTNNIILSGAFKLHKTLLHFVWVVTMELLKVTELFIDQCEGPNSKKGGGNSVPVLKPVPKPQAEVALSNSQFFNNDEDSGQKSNPITVIQIDDLYEMLREALPTTQVKLLKIPFQNTWRQCITETNLPL